MSRRTRLALFLTAETALFAAASLVHAGILASGFEHARAMIAEGVIGAVLGLGLLALLIWPTRGPIIALAAQGFWDRKRDGAGESCGRRPKRAVARRVHGARSSSRGRTRRDSDPSDPGTARPRSPALRSLAIRNRIGAYPGHQHIGSNTHPLPRLPITHVMDISSIGGFRTVARVKNRSIDRKRFELFYR
jgi:hypothetical protein